MQCCVSPDEGSWLLAAEDFARTGKDAFRWDEFERMFLEDADEEQAREVRAYWDRYLPLHKLVEGDYEYLALGTDRSSEHFGKVVWAAEAAYDEDPWSSPGPTRISSSGCGTWRGAIRPAPPMPTLRSRG